MESTVGREIIPVMRGFLEGDLRELTRLAQEKNVVLLVWGDPLSATTHVYILLELERRGIPVKYLPGVSVLTAIPSLLGLHHYKLGPPVTMPHFWEQAPSFMKKIKRNRELGLHTLLLLDVDPPITVDVAAHALKQFFGNIPAVGVARAFWKDQKIVFGTLEELESIDWGRGPQSLVIPGKLHPMEEESLGRFRNKG